MKIYRAISRIHNLEVKLFWLFVVASVAAAALYVCLVNAVIMNVVARKNATEAAALASAEIASLESRYLAVANTISIDKAYDLGFADVGNRSSFAYVGGQGAVSMR